MLIGEAGSTSPGVESSLFRFLAFFSRCARKAIVEKIMMLKPAMTAAALLPAVTNG